MPIMINITQTKYEGSQADHHLSEKNAADALFRKSKATRFRAMVIASPKSPTNLHELADPIDLHVLMCSIPYLLFGCSR